MANFIDTILTKYDLDPDDYVAGAKRINQATDAIAEQLKKLGGSAVGTYVTGKLKGIFSEATHMAQSFLSGGHLLSMGENAVKAAAAFDTMQRSLEAVTGSAQRAKAILAFDDKLAMNSTFKSDQLERASMNLEAFKMKTEQFLPVAEKLGMLFGNNEEALQGFTKALTSIKGGQFKDGFDALKKTGLDQKAFESKGLKFDANGEFKGSADQALQAVQQLVDERFGRMASEMAHGPAAVLSHVMESIGEAARTAGSAILSVLLPAAEKVGGFIHYLVESGAIEQVASGFANLFSGKNIGDGLVSAIAWVVAALKRGPDLIKAVGSGFERLIFWLRDNLAALGTLFAGIWAFTSVVKGFETIVEAIKVLREAESALAVVASIREAIETDGLSILATAALGALAAGAAMLAVKKLMPTVSKLPGIDGLQKVLDGISKDQASMVAGFSRMPGETDKGETTPLSNIAQDAAKQQRSATQQIAENTAKTAKNTDTLKEIQRSMLGGGEMGRLGLTPVELAGIRRGGASKVESKMRELMLAFYEEMSSVHSTGMKSRARMAR